jgi:hypothetical protein
MNLRGLLTLAIALALAIAGGDAFAADPPHTTITSGPTGDSTLHSPQFTFSSDQSGTFECSLDGAAFAACGSPMTLRNLTFGQHSFSVRAINDTGDADPAPPAVSWSIVPSPQETTNIVLRQPKKTSVAIKNFRALAGTTSSVGALKRVQIALTFGGPDKNYFPPRCWFIDMQAGSLIHQACVLPPYLTVSGVGKWHYSIPKAVRRKIPNGRYVLMVRTINSYGATFVKRFRLTLR